MSIRDGLEPSRSPDSETHTQPIPRDEATPGSIVEVHYVGVSWQTGKQFDGLGHIGIGDLFYNGNRGSEFAKAEGLAKLGVENVGPLATRGVLIDVAAAKGQTMLAGGYEITRADIESALKRWPAVWRWAGYWERLCWSTLNSWDIGALFSTWFSLRMCRRGISGKS